MTDAQKVAALTDLLDKVIHALEMKMYDIEDPQLSHECEVQADQFYADMVEITILQSEGN